MDFTGKRCKHLIVALPRLPVTQHCNCRHPVPQGTRNKRLGDPTGMVVRGGGRGDIGVRVQCSSCLGQQRFARLIGAWEQPTVAGWLCDRAASLQSAAGA